MYLLKNFLLTLTLAVVSMVSLNAQSILPFSPGAVNNVSQATVDYIMANATNQKVVKGWYQSLVSAGHMYQREANLITNFHKNNLNAGANEQIQKYRLRSLANSLKGLAIKSATGIYLADLFTQLTQTKWETFNDDGGTDSEEWDPSEGSSDDGEGSTTQTTSDDSSDGNGGRITPSEMVIVTVMGLGATTATGAATGAVAGAILGPPGTMAGAATGAAIGACAGVAGGAVALATVGLGTAIVD